MLQPQHINTKFVFRFAVFTFLCCFFSLTTVHPVQAKDDIYSNVPQENTEINISEKVVIVTGRISAGYLTGKANELVYWPAGSSTKLSQLTWTLDNVFMVGGGISVQPLEWLKFNADVFVKANDGSGEMDDYDWLYTTSEWSDWSHHDDVELTKGSMFDINAEFIFFQRREATLSGIIGYKRDNWEWEGRGGDVVYSTYSFRDTTGYFPDDLLVITYEQTFNVPYIGIGFQADLDPVYLSGRLIGSTLFSATAKDHHHLRNLYFEDEFENGNMVGLDIGGTYKFTDHLALMAKYHFYKYFTTDGDTTITNQSTGAKTVYNDIAGINNQVNLFSLSLIYMF